MPGIIMNDPIRRMSRRRLVGSAAALTGGLLLHRGVLAQDEDDAETIQIQSTELGPVPSTGTVRGGFVGEQPAAPQESQTAIPTALMIESIGIDAQIEAVSYTHLRAHE